MYKSLFLLVVILDILFAGWTSIDELPSALKHRHPKALTPVDARRSVGCSDFLAQHPDNLSSSKVPIVIIDSGFVGLSKYLKKHPAEKKRIKKWLSFYKKGKKSTSKHGLKVFRSALIDAPNSDYYLLQIDTKDDSSLARALKYMKKHHLHMANVSFGKSVFYGDYDRLHLKLDKLLEKYQITLFQSIGNTRAQAHYFKYSDVNHNGALEFIKPTTSKIVRFEYNRVKFIKKLKGEIFLAWHHKDSKDIKNHIDLRFVNVHNKRVNVKIEKFDDGILATYKPSKSQIIYFQVLDKGIVKPNDKYFSLFAKNVSTSKMYANGFGVAAKKSLVESPFIVSIGSYGAEEDGKLAPSRFSSYSKTVDGRLLPHILGPGQLKIGNKKIEGTSFSSPFISAIYSKYGGYNFKNLVQSSCSKRLLSKDLLPIEKSRWGIPDIKALAKSRCFFSDKIENFKIRKTEDKIALSFDFSRNCMEHLKHMLAVKFISAISDSNGKKKYKYSKKYYSKVFKSLDKDIKKEHTVIKVPTKDIKKIFRDDSIEIKFYILTTTYSKSIPIKTKKVFVLPKKFLN